MKWDDLISGLGFAIVAVIGGIVAHIRQYEITRQERTFSEHFWGVVRRAVMGGFGGLLVYFAWRGASWPEAYGYFVAGIVGLFASEAFEFFWDLLKRVLAKKAGLTSTTTTTNSNVNTSTMTKEGDSL